MKVVFQLDMYLSSACAFGKVYALWVLSQFLSYNIRHMFAYRIVAASSSVLVVPSAPFRLLLLGLCSGPVSAFFPFCHALETGLFD